MSIRTWAWCPTTVCSPDVRVANIRQFLHEQGFFALKGGGEETLVRDQVREEDIDWERTPGLYEGRQGIRHFHQRRARAEIRPH